MNELEKQVKRETRRVNAGAGDYDRLCQLRKQLAQALLKGGRRHKASGIVMITVTRSQLALLNKVDFPSGAVIKINGYSIQCNGLETFAYRLAHLEPLYEHQMPEYIRRFVF